MRALSHLSVAKAEVGGCPLARHRTAKLDNGRAFAIAGGIGLPRTWGTVTEWALDGFEEGFSRGREKDRLDEGLRESQQRVSRACSRLVERNVPDVALAAVMVQDSSLELIVVGPLRLYLFRGGDAIRLTPKQEEEEGLLRGRATRVSTPLHAEDLVLLGSVSAFSVQAIAQVTATLKSDPQTPPSVVATLLTEPAAATGVGAGAIALQFL